MQKTLQKADQAAKQEYFHDAFLKYLVKPAKGLIQSLSGEKPATFDVLGRAPMADEVIQQDELLDAPVIWKTPGIRYQRIQLSLSYQMVIKVWDGKEYRIQLEPETMERVKEFIPARE